MPIAKPIGVKSGTDLSVERLKAAKAITFNTDDA